MEAGNSGERGSPWDMAAGDHRGDTGHQKPPVGERPGIELLMFNLKLLTALLLGLKDLEKKNIGGMFI